MPPQANKETEGGLAVAEYLGVRNYISEAVSAIMHQPTEQIKRSVIRKVYSSYGRFQAEPLRSGDPQLGAAIRDARARRAAEALLQQRNEARTTQSAHHGWTRPGKVHSAAQQERLRAIARERAGIEDYGDRALLPARFLIRRAGGGQKMAGRARQWRERQA